MTLSEAIENPGAPVTYTHPATGVIEPGIIRSVAVAHRGMVFVQYGPDIWETDPVNIAFDRSRR
ncbi:hypothetical protein [Rhodococcus globerulus]|uniref:Uncharacterized protein n=1 Tax=Rhodococcus globerulus TaxID=33008 RepID=A0ABU4BSM3_RHOGO|nr:hypothetical protein [Rhodococcus globerulus]MDV6267038.1 hypothetical protein [Rhodococcus globerulus]